MIYIKLAAITNVPTGVWDSDVLATEPELQSERLVPLHVYLAEKDQKLNETIAHLVELAKLVISIQQKLEGPKIILPGG